MVLSDKEIRKCIENGQELVKPFNEDRLQAASYDITMSGEISVCRNTSGVVRLSDEDAIADMFKNTRIPASGYILKPGEYILTLLNETISVPVDMCAHIRPRTRFTRMGILLSAQHLNPGYTGRLSMGLYNASSSAVLLVPNLKIGQVVFETLTSTPSEEKQYQNKKDAAYSGEQQIRRSTFAGKEFSPEAMALYEKVMKELSGEA